MKVVKATELVKPKNLLKPEKARCVIVKAIKEEFKDANFNELSTLDDFIIYICVKIENTIKKRLFKKDIKVDKKELAIKILEMLAGRVFSAQEKLNFSKTIDTACNNKVVKKVKKTKVIFKNILSLINSFL